MAKKSVLKNKHETKEGVECDDPILVALKVTFLGAQQPNFRNSS